MKRPCSFVFCALLLFLGSAPSTSIALTLDTYIDNRSPSKRYPITSHTTEKMLIDSLHAIQEQRMDVALYEMENLLEKHPEFHLAQLIYGDLLMSKGRRITNVGNYSDGPPEKITDLKEEARQRLKYYLHQPNPYTVPEYLVNLAENVTHVVLLDIHQSRLYLYENQYGNIRLRASYYASVGKNGSPKQSEGDQKTPIGVYLTTGNISNDELPDRYGIGAFPINYPNEWDKRFGRTGYGIWIHGVPQNTYSRPPLSSDGCIVISNEDLLSIKDILAIPNTPVIIADHIPWTKKRDIDIRRNRFRKKFEAWRRDWESRNHQRYARHYSWNFRSGIEGRSSWLQYKKRINAQKRYIKVKISNMSIFGYPGEPDTLIVTFDQDYRSSNYSTQGRKHQYWRRENNDGEKKGVWRIIQETSL